jgi:hypothetical protein
VDGSYDYPPVEPVESDDPVESAESTTRTAG